MAEKLHGGELPAAAQVNVFGMFAHRINHLVLFAEVHALL